ncbi:hypothetical protein HK405_003562 [Cladochytrium tenue]|nr:hypothetical protein HK405_003562 [Cladochytrium tenue]
MYVDGADFARLRGELVTAEVNESAAVHSEARRLVGEAVRLQLRAGEEVRRVQASVRGELAAERARAREMRGERELRVREAVARAETEVAAVATTVESIPWELFKTLFPLFCAAGALAFSYLRFIR